VFLLAGSNPVCGQLLIGWDVAGLTGTNNNVAPVYLAANVITGLITRGPGLTPSAATNSITSTSWTLPNNSAIADSIASNDYYSVTLTADPGFEFAITGMSLRVQRSNTGPSNYTLRANVDAFGADLTTWNIGGSTTAQSIQTPLSIGGTNSVEFRIYGHRADTASGTGRIQDGGSFGQAGVDLGIFGWTTSGAPAAAEISLLGTNGGVIADGDTSPSVTDGTDFGTTDVATGLVTRTFAITNSGDATLTISGMTTSGTHAADFSVLSYPSTVSPGNWSNLVIQFNPASNGLRTATIIVNNNDVDESAYDFTVQGTGTSAPSSTPPNMALITAGNFVMGNATNVFPASEGFNSELPQHTVNVSAFYMDIYEVTKALWDEVKAYNGGNGYSYSNTGFGKATNHPVHTVNWFDVVKWCNARSERDGLTPVYYSDAGLTTLYKTNEIAPFANWAANGYRLPTEAEWEKAARGGASNTRFPWTDYTNKISWAKANYYGESNLYSYDLNGGSGAYHPSFTNTTSPYTSPVGYFAPNGFGLCDMAGNVMEWCWDWYQSTYYESSPTSDPSGPAGPLSSRVLRGGCWNFEANYARVASRLAPNPEDELYNIGFRCARGLGLSDPEIAILGTNGLLVSDGDLSPDVADGTDFGAADVTTGLVTRTFAITNSGTATLTISGVATSGTHAANFVVVSFPPSVDVGTKSNLVIQFNPSAIGFRFATITVTNNDSDEASYDFVVQGTGTMPSPEIDMLGTNGVSIQDGDLTPSPLDGTDFGSMDVRTGVVVRTFSITNSGTAVLTISGVTTGGTRAAEFKVQSFPSSVSPGTQSNLVIQFNPSGLGQRTASIFVHNNDANESTYDFAVQGTGTSAPISGTRYVSTNSPNPEFPHTNWHTAARVIQDAVDVAMEGDTVLVTNGTYTAGPIGTRVILTNGITLRSLNGPAVTVIDGGNVARCLSVGNQNALVEGFTIKNGYNSSSGGGAVMSAGALRSCIVVSNHVYEGSFAPESASGGGLYLSGNSTVDNCLITHNTATSEGGITSPDGLNFYYFPGYSYGGGIYQNSSNVLIRNCTIAMNIASVIGSDADIVYGGGIFSSFAVGGATSVVNCIIASNRVENAVPGGISEGTNYYNTAMTFSCAAPVAPGVGNIGVDPVFANVAGGDFRLQSNSPCINTGTNQPWMTGATDLDGKPRIANDVVDMGAYEYLLLVNTLTILGDPEPHGISSPYNYGVHVLAAGITITNTVVSPADESPGQRFVASGWTGIGSLPTSGVGTVVSFTLTNDTTLTWTWTRQFTLVQSSTLVGAFSTTTNWWSEGAMASTVLAPLVATGSLYYFAEWRDAGQRLPDNTSPASNPAGILMNTAKTAVAVYYLEGVDSNGDGLEDWFQRRHFGTNTPSANADVDLDGQTNKEEQEADTNPNNPGSVFKMNRITSSGVQTNFEIRITTQPYRKYTIEFSDVNLAIGGGWRTFSNLANGVGTWVELSFSSNSFTFIDNFSTNTSGYPPTNGLRHYRIRVADAPFITFYRDIDGDGYGSSAMQISAPLAPNGYVAIAGDCKDNAPSTYPGALELCGNGIDDDCDEQTDEIVCNDGSACTLDVCENGVCVYVPISCDDGNPCTDDLCDSLLGCNNIMNTNSVLCYSGPPGTMGIGACQAGTKTCFAGLYGPCVGEVVPSVEICDGIDNNCNGQVDEGSGGAGCTTFYFDGDGDGWGLVGDSICLCTPSGFYSATLSGDCDDSAPEINPGAPELCGNGIDDNCDGLTDEVNLDDGVPCTIDACVDGVVVHTPNHSLCDDGIPCTIETCDPLIGCVQTSALGCFAWSPALNCMEIKANNPAAPSGVYWIDLDGTGTNAPFQIYCDMTSE